MYRKIGEIEGSLNQLKTITNIYENFVKDKKLTISLNQLLISITNGLKPKKDATVKKVFSKNYNPEKEKLEDSIVSKLSNQRSSDDHE